MFDRFWWRSCSTKSKRLFKRTLLNHMKDIMSFMCHNALKVQIESWYLAISGGATAFMCLLITSNVTFWVEAINKLQLAERRQTHLNSLPMNVSAVQFRPVRRNQRWLRTLLNWTRIQSWIHCVNKTSVVLSSGKNFISSSFPVATLNCRRLPALVLPGDRWTYFSVSHLQLPPCSTPKLDQIIHRQTVGANICWQS